MFVSMLFMWMRVCPFHAHMMPACANSPSPSTHNTRPLSLFLHPHTPIHVCTRTLGYYLTGDNARRDKDGYYWITGRADDVVIVSGKSEGYLDVGWLCM